MSDSDPRLVPTTGNAEVVKGNGENGNDGKMDANSDPSGHGNGANNDDRKLQYEPQMEAQKLAGNVSGASGEKMEAESSSLKRGRDHVGVAKNDPRASTASPIRKKKKKEADKEDGEVKHDPKEAVAAIQQALGFLREYKAENGNKDEDVEKTITASGSKTLQDYEIIRQVGVGTYGEVYKARNRKTGDIVALKKVKVHHAKDGYPITALREMKFMQKLKHKNIVNLHDIVPSSTQLKEKDLGEVFMVMEYLDNDLTGLLTSSNSSVSLADKYVRCYMKQLLEGLHYIHTNKVIHRDLKSSNILVSNDSRLKIGDWGLSRSWTANSKYTTKVVTLWYRAPELLLGIEHYTSAIDMWAVGCIFAELLGKGCSPLPGEEELAQLKLIFDLCGTPTEETWPGISQTKLFKQIKFEKKEATIDRRFAWMKPLELDLLKRFLTLDPRKRISAAEALDHDYFWKDSVTSNPEDLPKLVGEGVHEFEARLIRAAQREERSKSQQQQYHHSRGGGRGNYHNSNNNNGSKYYGNRPRSSSSSKGYGHHKNSR